MTRLRFQPTLIFLLAAWLGIVAFAANMLMHSEIRRAELRFDEEIRVLASDLKHKLDTNEAVLAGFAAFLQAVDRSDTNSAMRYAASATASYPHIYMLEVARKVDLSDATQLEAALRKGWRADFTIKNFAEITGQSFKGDGEKKATWPILFMYPSLPEAQAIYGVQLETVDYLSHPMALAQQNVKPVVSPVFSLYEGNTAFILMQEVNRPADMSSADLNFFGNTMMAFLLIKTQALIPAVRKNNGQSHIHVLATLEPVVNAHGTLFELPAEISGKLDRLFLPVFKRKIVIENASQPTVMDFEQQLRWGDFLSFEMMAVLTLLGAALLVVPVITMRHYQALGRAETEHERSSYLATHDLLTALPNRFLFTDRFEQAFQRWQRDGNSFALLLLDLDHFKDVNDRYGHDVGDQVLIACAKRMALELRACDTVARHGGDEFLILLGSVLSKEDAEAVGEKILLAFVEPIKTTAGLLKVTCSIGVAVCPLHGSNLESLRKAADAAMYRAKEQGRNTLSVCSDLPTV
jgi:diguanylate cyclase (GGDEF)-like protein